MSAQVFLTPRTFVDFPAGTLLHYYPSETPVGQLLRYLQSQYLEFRTSRSRITEAGLDGDQGIFEQSAYSRLEKGMLHFARESAVANLDRMVLATELDAQHVAIIHGSDNTFSRYGGNISPSMAQRALLYAVPLLEKDSLMGQGIWKTLEYLEQRGIIPGLFEQLQGPDGNMRSVSSQDQAVHQLLDTQASELAGAFDNLVEKGNYYTAVAQLMARATAAQPELVAHVPRHIRFWSTVPISPHGVIHPPNRLAYMSFDDFQYLSRNKASRAQLRNRLPPTQLPLLKAHDYR